MPDLEYKSFAEFKFLDGNQGGFDGYGSLFGVLDSGGDIVERGAFTDTIHQFMANGFIALGHNWNELPIGYPVEAKEDERGLYIRAEYHSTPEAQQARRVAQERMGRGLSVGLSIGYIPEAAGSDGEGNRLIRKVGLFEVSQVNVPMLRPAGMTATKNLRYAEESDRMLTEFPAWIDRTKSLVNLLLVDLKEGRPISTARRARMMSHLAALRERVLPDAAAVAEDIEALLVETEPQPKALPQEPPAAVNPLAGLHARFRELEARHAGLFQN